MWRTIVLGKLIISIIASIIIGFICIVSARQPDQTIAASTQWWLLGFFFLGLAISFATVMYLLFYRKKRKE